MRVGAAEDGEHVAHFVGKGRGGQQMLERQQIRKHAGHVQLLCAGFHLIIAGRHHIQRQIFRGFRDLLEFIRDMLIFLQIKEIHDFLAVFPDFIRRAFGAQHRIIQGDDAGIIVVLPVNRPRS